MFKFHRFILRSSADMYVSPSELREIELIWYACALAYTFRGTAATILSWKAMRGKRRFEGGGGLPEAEEKKPLALLVEEDAEGVDGVAVGWKSEVFKEPEESEEADRLFSATTLSDFSKTFHSLIVLSEVGEMRVE
jgi:hypothetical protein